MKEVEELARESLRKHICIDLWGMTCKYYDTCAYCNGKNEMNYFDAGCGAYEYIIGYIHGSEEMLKKNNK